MKAGALRHRIEILSPTIQVDTFGQDIETFETDGEWWAKISEEERDEIQANEGTTGKRRIKVLMRVGTPVLRRSQIIFNNQTFNVLSVIDPDGRNTSMEAVAEEQN